MCYFVILYFLKGYRSDSRAPQCRKETHSLGNFIFSCKNDYLFYTRKSDWADTTFSYKISKERNIISDRGVEEGGGAKKSGCISTTWTNILTHNCLRVWTIVPQGHKFSIHRKSILGTNFYNSMKNTNQCRCLVKTFQLVTRIPPCLWKHASVNIPIVCKEIA